MGKLPESTGTFTGYWGDSGNLPLPEPKEQKTIICTRHVRELGIDWWVSQYSFNARYTWANTVKIGSQEYFAERPEVTVQPLSDVVTEYAEWWRRWGYYVIATPYHWVAEHTFRPWARWIVRDELALDDYEDEA